MLSVFGSVMMSLACHLSSLRLSVAFVLKMTMIVFTISGFCEGEGANDLM